MPEFQSIHRVTNLAGDFLFRGGGCWSHGVDSFNIVRNCKDLTLSYRMLHLPISGHVPFLWEQAWNTHCWNVNTQHYNEAILKQSEMQLWKPAPSPAVSAFLEEIVDMPRLHLPFRNPLLLSLPRNPFPNHLEPHRFGGRKCPIRCRMKKLKV